MYPTVLLGRANTFAVMRASFNDATAALFFHAVADSFRLVVLQSFVEGSGEEREVPYKPHEDVPQA